MPLQPQEIEIPLNLGMATKPSEELQEPSTMRLVQNLHWRGIGEIERGPAAGNGVSLSAPSGVPFTDGSSACGLITRAGSPVVVTAQHGAATWDGTLNGGLQWARRTVASTSTPSSDTALKHCPVSADVWSRTVDSASGTAGSSGIVNCTSVMYEGVLVMCISYASTSSVNTLRFRAIDPETGREVATTETVTSATLLSACKYTESGKEGVLFAYTTNTSAPYTVATLRYSASSKQFVADSNLTTNASAAYAFLKHNPATNRVYFAFSDNTSSVLVVQDRTIGTISSTHTATHDYSGGIDIVIGNGGTLILSVVGGSSMRVEMFGTPAGVSTAVSGGTIRTVTAALVTRSGFTDFCSFFVGFGVSNGGYTQASSLDFSGGVFTLTGGSSIVPGCAPLGRAFSYEGRAYVTLVLSPYVVGGLRYDRNTTAVLVRHSAYTSTSPTASRCDVVAKVCFERLFFRSVAGGVVYVDDLQNVDVDGNGDVWGAYVTDRPEYSTTISTLDYWLPQSVTLTRVSLRRPMPVPYALVDRGVTLVAGGNPWEHDGSTPCEVAPLDIPYLAASLSGGSFTGTYGAIAIIRWVDKAGRLHRVVSDPLTITASSNRIDITVSRIACSTYDAEGGTEVEADCWLYMTTNGGSTYYLVADTSGNRMQPGVTSNDCFYEFLDVQPGSLGAGLINITDALFTTEIQPTPVPAFLHVAKIGDRIWAVDAEDRSRIWFSKPLVAGYASEWSAVNTLTVGDEATAVVDVGGFPTVLARGGIYQIAGAGPDATGAGSFAPAQKMPYEVECVDPVSVCRTPMGVVFRGRRGLYILGNGLSDQPGILLDSEMLVDPTSDTPVSAEYRLRVVYQESTSEIHVLTPGRRRLVYNVIEQKWSKYDYGEDIHDIAVANGRLYFLDTLLGTNRLFVEKSFAVDGAGYNDASDTGWRIDTPWYRMDDVAGQVKLWRAALALRLPSDPADCSISVTYYWDWSETDSQVVTWSGSELATYASTGDAVVKLPIVPSRQTVTAFKFKIECTMNASSSSPKPLALRLQLGQRPSKSKRSNSTVKG